MYQKYNWKKELYRLKRRLLECTVEALLKDHPIGHKNVVSQDRWSLVTGSVMLKCRSFCHKCVVFQDRWSHMAGFTVYGI